MCYIGIIVSMSKYNNEVLPKDTIINHKYYWNKNVNENIWIG